MSAILARQAEFCSRHGICLANGRSDGWLVCSVVLPDFPEVVLGRIEESEDGNRLGRELKRGKSRSALRVTDETFLGLASPSILSAASGSPRIETAVRVATS
jgi:hypothetical protein